MDQVDLLISQLKFTFVKLQKMSQIILEFSGTFKHTQHPSDHFQQSILRKPGLAEGVTPLQILADFTKCISQGRITGFRDNEL